MTVWWLVALGCKGGGDPDTDDTDGSGAPTYALTVTGTAYDPHDGAVMHLALFDADAAELVDVEDADISGGAWSWNATGVLIEGVSYVVAWYVDLDADGDCDVPPTDHVWRDAEAAALVDGDVEILHSHSADDFDALGCDPFSYL
jgi:hypothetical protein